MDRRVIPSVEQVRQRPAVRTLEGTYGRDAIVTAIRAEVEIIKARLGAGGDDTVDAPPGREDLLAALEQGVAARLVSMTRPSLVPVLNATGVIVHTNLGRAPLAAPALASLHAVAAGYSNLEYDLADGRRGARDLHAERLLRTLTGAEAAVVVNNNAAATLLILASLAAGREVIVSRGELVEIGGGFRVPEVMSQSGAILREVGTTNRTRASDYAAALCERTALILRVHRSNFRIEGFTEQPSVASLVEIGRAHGIPVVEDQGSGYLGPPAAAAGGEVDRALAGEPTPVASLAAGVDVVCFSGDKLLGGPQAGIVVGRAALVARIRRHPLMRAVRVDKLAYGALEATLAEYVAGRAARTVPVLRMLGATIDEIGARAERLATRLRQSGRFETDVIDGASAVGGGSAPGLEVRTRLVAVSAAGLAPDRLDERLRAGSPPLVGRIESGRFVIDLRTVPADQDETVLAALLAAQRG